MKKLLFFCLFLHLQYSTYTQTYCLTFSTPVAQTNGTFIVNYTFVPTVAVDASVMIFDAVENVVDIIPLAPGGRSVYEPGSFVLPSAVFSFVDLGVYTASTGDVVTPFCATAVLPVELTTFDAQITKEGNLLDWATETEINSRNFEVERSLDGINFTKIAEISSKGDASIYNYLDKLPFKNILYYRLKMNDLDGKYEYSKVVSMSKKNEAFSLYSFPNPFGEVLNVTVVSENEKTLEIDLFDVYGRLVYASTVNYDDQENNFDISTQNLPAGIYVLTLSDGNETIEQKIIKL
jgi:hypothetical protein